MYTFFAYSLAHGCSQRFYFLCILPVYLSREIARLIIQISQSAELESETDAETFASLNQISIGFLATTASICTVCILLQAQSWQKISAKLCKMELKLSNYEHLMGNFTAGVIVFNQASPVTDKNSSESLGGQTVNHPN